MDGAENAGDETPEDGAQGEGDAPHRFFLFIGGEAPPPVVLELDKPAAIALFGEQAARRIRVLDVDTTELLENALVAIRDACGVGWQRDAKDPGYDCSLTALGRSYGPAWRTSAAFSLTRLLGTTAANSNVEGTSLAPFAALLTENPGTFRFDFADVLSESLGVSRTEPLVKTSILVRALQKNLLGSHPAVRDPSGKLPVSLWDALSDFETLPETLGPAGDHPGILVPDDPGSGFTTRSDALGPDFRMRVAAFSNLVRVHGMDLSTGAGDMFVKEGRAPLSFDFEDPKGLVVTGLAHQPTIDMRFSVHEAPTKIKSCASDPACKPFTLEAIVTEAAKQSYGHRDFSRCFLMLQGSCLVGMDLGRRGASPGVISFENALRGVPVPPPTPIWDLLDEVVQAAFHDPTGDGTPDIPEGQAKPIFALRGLRIGPTGEELVEKMRPMLAAQADEIADVVAGRYWENNDTLDWYVRKDERSGMPWLYFVAPSDERPDPARPGERLAYRYARPGFFSSPDLSEASRLSARVISGISDTEHEKIGLSPGKTVLYVEDDEGARYELELFWPEDGEQALSVEVRRSP